LQFNRTYESKGYVFGGLSPAFVRRLCPVCVISRISWPISFIERGSRRSHSPHRTGSEEHKCQHNSCDDEQNVDDEVASHSLASQGRHYSANRKVKKRQNGRLKRLLPLASLQLWLNDVEQTDADVRIPPHGQDSADVFVFSGAAGDFAY
jgi:hypothetical protein